MTTIHTTQLDVQAFFAEHYRDGAKMSRDSAGHMVCDYLNCWHLIGDAPVGAPATAEQQMRLFVPKPKPKDADQAEASIGAPA